MQGGTRSLIVIVTQVNFWSFDTLIPAKSDLQENLYPNIFHNIPILRYTIENC